MSTYSVHDAIVSAASKSNGFVDIAVAVDEAKRNLELVQAVETLLMDAEVRVRTEALASMPPEPVLVQKPTRWFFLGGLKREQLSDLRTRFGKGNLYACANRFNGSVYAAILTDEQVLELAVEGLIRKPVQPWTAEQFDSQATWAVIDAETL